METYCLLEKSATDAGSELPDLGRSLSLLGVQGPLSTAYAFLRVDLGGVRGPTCNLGGCGRLAHRQFFRGQLSTGGGRDRRALSGRVGRRLAHGDRLGDGRGDQRRTLAVTVVVGAVGAVVGGGVEIVRAVGAGRADSIGDVDVAIERAARVLVDVGVGRVGEGALVESLLGIEDRSGVDINRGPAVVAAGTGQRMDVQMALAEVGRTRASTAERRLRRHEIGHSVGAGSVAHEGRVEIIHRQLIDGGIESVGGQVDVGAIELQARGEAGAHASLNAGLEAGVRRHVVGGRGLKGDAVRVKAGLGEGGIESEGGGGCYWRWYLPVLYHGGRWIAGGVLEGGGGRGHWQRTGGAGGERGRGH